MSNAVLVICFFLGLCIAGFVMGIISLTKNSTANSESSLLSFESEVPNGQNWPFASGAEVIAGTFFAPQSGFLSHLTILGNVFSPDQQEQTVHFQLEVRQAPTIQEWSVTGEGQSGVEFQDAGYSTQTTFSIQTGQLKTFSGFALNTNRLRIQQGTQIQLVVKVTYSYSGFINYLASVRWEPDSN